MSALPILSYRRMALRAGLVVAGLTVYGLLFWMPVLADRNPPADDYFFLVAGRMRDASGFTFEFVLGPPFGAHVGTFSVRRGKSIQGPGFGNPNTNKFRILDPNGNVFFEGTWRATQLESYHSYGVGIVIPPFGTPREAGVMHAKIELTTNGGVVIPARLVLFCMLPEVVVPPPTFEHYEVHIGDWHFKFGGAGTLFIQQP